MEGKLLPIRRTSGAVASMSDEALLAACATGDMAALDALFERFHVALYRFLGRLLPNDRSACDDLVQATFLEVRRMARSFRGTSSVKTWILGIGSNVARHQLRGERRRRVRQHHYAEGLAVLAARPDEQFEQRELLARAARALATLPHHQQVAFVLCDLEQVPGVDVARALGVPEGTIWRRLHVARKAIRAAIEAIS
ncbi:MAG TPA: RNA polymerase sigma factor [Burkholderiaceae bacterium]|nr:RNA polymerase sigma factor [Burkholderiaceae bacterium]